ncbi:OsmC family protein [Chloroflexota bacterium]
MSEQQGSIYRSSVSWDKRIGGELHVRDLQPISVSMPVAHGGDGINPCPIELLISALTSCFLGTFLVFKRQLRLKLKDIQVSAQGSVEMIKEKEDRGKYDITGVELSVHIIIADDEFEQAIAEDCIRLAEEHCPVSRTLKKAVPVTVKSKIEVLPE